MDKTTYVEIWCQSYTNQYEIKKKTTPLVFFVFFVFFFLGGGGGGRSLKTERCSKRSIEWIGKLLGGDLIRTACRSWINFLGSYHRSQVNCYGCNTKCYSFGYNYVSVYYIITVSDKADDNHITLEKNSAAAPARFIPFECALNFTREDPNLQWYIVSTPLLD